MLCIAALLPVSEEVRCNLRPGDTRELDNVHLPFPGKLESSSIAGSVTSLDSQVSIVITTSSSPPPDDDPSDHRYIWPTKCQNMLLDPGILNDTQTQSLLLTTLVSFSVLTREYVKRGLSYSSWRQNSLDRSVSGLLTLSPRYLMATCLGTALEGGEGGS